MQSCILNLNMTFKAIQSIVIHQSTNCATKFAKSSLSKIKPKWYLDCQISSKMPQGITFFPCGVPKLTILARDAALKLGITPLRIINGSKIIGYGIRTDLLDGVKPQLKSHFYDKISDKLFCKGVWSSLVNQIKG
jgi:hypothetical protein